MATITSNGTGGGTWSAGATWNGGVVPNDTADDAVIADGDTVTLSGNDSCKSLTIQGGGIFDGNGNTLEIAGKDSGDKALNLDGEISGTDTDFDIRTASACDLDLQCTGEIRNLIINDASCVATLVKPVTLSGGLTITAGTLDTGADHALTVDGKTTITGTLTCNASTVSLGSGVTSDWGIEMAANGTFNGGSGTHTAGAIKCTTDSTFDFTNQTTTINAESTSNNRFFELTDGNVTHSSGTIILTAASTADIQWYTTEGDNGPWDLTINNASCRTGGRTDITILNDLTITAGEYNTQSTSVSAKPNLTVTGDVSVTGTLTGNDSAISMGSLTIQVGGTYTATSATTTITGESDAGMAWNNVETDGTGFAHSDGKVSFTTPASTAIRENTFYDFEMTADAAGRVYDFRDVTGDTITIANDLTIKEGILKRTTVGDTFTVTGDVSIESGGTLGHADETGANNFGTLTIESGGEYKATSGTTTLNGDGRGYGGYASALENKSGGTFTNNDGTVLINSSGDQEIKMDGTGNVHNLTVNKSDNDLVHEGSLTVEGDLSITLATGHSMRPNTGASTLTVTGDVTIVEGKLGDTTNYTGAISFGSLTIESGGTYIATNDTTTIKGNASSSSNLAWKNNGTFTHNSGTVLFDGTNTFGGSSYGHIQPVTQTFNNLTINADSKYIQFRGSSQTVTVAGDLTVTDGALMNYGTNTATITVTGDVSIADGATLGANTGGNDMVAPMNFGSLTIADGGTFIATTDTTTIASNLENNGTFTHNEGTVDMTGSNGYINNILASTATTLHNLTCTNNIQLADKNNTFTIEGTLTIASGKVLYMRSYPSSGNPVVLAMGKSTATTVAEGGSITGAGKIHFNNTDDACTVKGMSTVYPCVVNSADWEWDGMGTGVGNEGDIRIANLDYDPNLTTGGDETTITLEGDCEFDAVTVSSGDTLDLGGNRAVFGGILSGDGTLTATDSMLVFQGTSGVVFDVGDGPDLAVVDNSGTSYISDAGAGNTVSWKERFQSSEATVFLQSGKLQPDYWTWSDVGTLNIGSGIFDNDDSRTMNAANIIIPTGGTLSGTAATYNISGDFTTAGGLIGKSALDLDGTQYAAQSTKTDWGFTNDFTIETWLNTTDTDARFMDMANGEDGNNRISLSIESGELRIAITGSNVETSGYSAIVTGGTWVHAAFTYDGTDAQIYVNGKLAASSDLSVTRGADPDMEMWIGCGIDAAAGTFYTGKMGRFSLWSSVLSASDIRTMMFQKFADATTTTCEAWYEFDEGTSTAVANSEGTAARALTLDEAAWVGAGDFDYGSTSTVDLTGTGDLSYEGNINFYNLKCAASTKTTTVNRRSSGTLYIRNNLYNGGGTLARSGAVTYAFMGVASAPLSGAASPIDMSNCYVAYWSSTGVVPASTWEYFISDVSTVTLGGDVTSDNYFNTSTYETALAGNTLTCNDFRFGDSVNGHLNIGSGSLVLANALGLSTSYAGNQLSAGPGATISGTAAGRTFKSQNDWSVVGKVENLNVTNEELKVTGQVINCTGDIIQQHPSQDANQQLDYDTADDRDIQFGVPDLDKNTELVT